MQKVKILFFIKNLGGGGAEKVLINLLNRLDLNKFDITVRTIFDEGLYRTQLPTGIHYKSTFPKEFKGFVHLQKLFSARCLHRFFIKEHYDMEIAFLEGVCTRIVSGADTHTTKMVSWLHTGPGNDDYVMLKPYRNQSELKTVYHRFHQIMAVSEYAVTNLQRMVGADIPIQVQHNVIEKDTITALSLQDIAGFEVDKNVVNFCSVGRLTQLKGFHRVLESLGALKEKGYQKFHYYLLGEGAQRKELELLVSKFGLEAYVTFVGFQSNPYPYMRKMDWFICASYYEGFSSVVCEALIVDLPVITTDCSGMKEILGADNEYGIICENTDEAIQAQLQKVMDEPSLHTHYKSMAAMRAPFFDPDKNAAAVQTMVERLLLA